MDKLTELCEFLAWVQDNYTEASVESWISVDDENTREYTREEIVTCYLVEKGIGL